MPTKADKALLEQIRVRAEELGSNEALRKALGFSNSRYYDLAAGRRGVTVETLRKLKRAGVRLPSDLLG